MLNLSIDELLIATNGTCKEEHKSTIIDTISSDSRTINEGECYIAIIGERLDGHNFIKEVIGKKPICIIGSKDISIDNIPYIKVEDTTQALGDISSYYRERLGLKTVGITGSVGKTTTKDIVAAALSGKFKVGKAKENFNNEIGLPKTLFEMNDQVEIAVLEMGMYFKGEISHLSKVAKPSIGIITNIGVCHIKNFESREGILKAKLEIVDGLEKDGVLILNSDDKFLKNVDRSIASKVIFIGTNEKADLRAYDIIDNGRDGIAYKLKIENNEIEIKLPFVGLHNVTNSLAAIATGLEMGLTISEIENGIENYDSSSMRLDFEEKDKITFINDSYNASPDSMKAGLAVLKKEAQKGKAVAILGDMLELGNVSKDMHIEVGRECAKLDLDFVALFGRESEYIGQGIGCESKYKIFDSYEDIVDYMKVYLEAGDTVLVKGSRGMKMETVIRNW